MPDAQQWVFRTAHVAFFLLARPEHAGTIEERIAVGGERWTDRFITVTKLDGDDSVTDILLPATRITTAAPVAFYTGTPWVS